MMLQGLLLFIILASIQPGVQASEVSEELQVLQQQFVGLQQQMETMQWQMAMERLEMQQQMDTERQQMQQELQQQMATEKEKIQQQMATEREEMQQQMVTTAREEMQQQMATERQARQEESDKMQIKVEKMEQQMTSKTEEMQQQQQQQLKQQQQQQRMQQKMNHIEIENTKLKQNINNINVKLANVVHENQRLSDVVSVLKQDTADLSLGFQNVSDMVRETVGKHNGSFIAFSAYASETREYNDGIPVLFDLVITNVGSFYTPETSVFLCAYQGYYLFSLNVHTTTGDEMEAELIMDGTIIARLYADYADQDSASNTVVVFCPQFSQVYVRARNDGNTMYGHPTLQYSTFTGILLAQQ